MLTYSALYAQNNFAKLLEKAKEAHEVLNYTKENAERLFGIK